MDLVKAAIQVCCIGTLTLIAGPAMAAQPPVFCGTAQWQPYIAEAARRHEVPEGWIRGVMRAESAGCITMEGKPTRSAAGAMGLMQLMPETWAELKDRLHLGDNPDDPHDNVIAGAAYLRQLADRYGTTGVFAAYHAGPARYDEHLSTGRPLPAQTIAYLARVQRAIHASADMPLLAARDEASANPRDRLFVARSAPQRADTASQTAEAASLFVPLKHTHGAASHPENPSADVQHD